MDWSTRKDQPHKHLAGIGAVAALHLLAVYALVNGLGRKTAEVEQPLVETRIVEAVRKPPPERIVPPPPAPPTPKAALPPAPPPPPRAAALPARAPVPAVPTISATPPTPAPVPQPEAAPPSPSPPAPPAPAPPPAAPAASTMPAAAPLAQSVGIACPGYRKILEDAGIPREAQRVGVDSGDVKVEFIVTPNSEVRDVKVVSSTDRLLNRGSIEAVRRFRCDGQARDVRVEVEIHYTSQ